VGDGFYNLVRFCGSIIFWWSSKPVILHVERTARPGPFILAANHTSAYDVPLLVRHSRRHLDFVSITEVFQFPFVAWFFGSMNAFPVDRSKPDSRGVRTILERLKRKRVIGIFPEGHIRAPENAITHGGKARPGTGRLAVMAGVPIVPAVVINSAPYLKLTAWLPHRRVRYGIIFGPEILTPADLEKTEAAQKIESELEQAMIRLYRELLSQMPAA
jgi:1-acyl-sn-glycerol-3-phosphate acyltransferase